MRKATISYVMSVCLSALKNSVSIRQIFMRFDLFIFFENLSRKFKFNWNLTRITDTIHEDQYTVLMSRLILLRIRNFSDKSCRENQKTHFMSDNFFSENRTIYEMWKNVQAGSPQMTIWRMRIAWWIPKATNTHSEYIRYERCDIYLLQLGFHPVEYSYRNNGYANAPQCYVPRTSHVLH
jgi:hypothetical protein